MSDVREFWLENEKGKIWHFTSNESKSFLESPGGLGLANEYGGYRVGNSDVITFSQLQLLDITGTLLFFRETREEIYMNYFEFIKFIANSSVLKLHYRTPNSFDSFYRYVFVKQIDKSEIDNDLLVMRCPISFGTKTFWRNDNVNRVIASDVDSGEGKEYLLKRPYHYKYNTIDAINVINKGNIEAPLKITIKGDIKNPRVRIYDEFNNLYGVMRFIGDFDEVVVDSDDINEYIELIKDDSILTSPSSYQDLSVGSPNQIYVTFIKIKPGRSKIEVFNEVPLNGNVLVEWSDEYESV